MSNKLVTYCIADRYTVIVQVLAESDETINDLLTNELDGQRYDREISSVLCEDLCAEVDAMNYTVLEEEEV